MRITGYLDGVEQALTPSGPATAATTPAAIGNHFDLGAVTDNEGSDTGTIDDSVSTAAR